MPILTYALRKACNAPEASKMRPLLHVGLEVLQVDPAGAAGIVQREVNRGEQAAADPGRSDSQVEGHVGRDAAVELHLGHDRAGPVGVLPVADVEAVEDQARVA